jgi:hypothetical protein
VRRPVGLHGRDVVPHGVPPGDAAERRPDPLVAEHLDEPIAVLRAERLAHEARGDDPVDAGHAATTARATNAYSRKNSFQTPM